MKWTCLILFKAICILSLPFSCRQSVGFKDATAIWTFSDKNDKTADNSLLTQYGEVNLISLSTEDAKKSKLHGGDGIAARFNGGWFSAEQGANEELKFSGENFSMLIRLKVDKIKSYMPVINKAGNDRSLAYSIALSENDGDVYVESIIGSDDIAGSHLLRYKLPKDKITEWHDIIFRFNGKQSELYIDGILRDDEITVGEIRKWNRKPFLIGAQYLDDAGYASVSDKDAASNFEGMIDHVVLWNRYITDNEICNYSCVTEIRDGKPEYYSEKYRPQFHFTAKKNWINDPNGLFYYNGVYHMFFQYMPPKRPGAYKDWGHAVSTDLVHWEQIPNHITPHKVWGGCWSGSAVVDFNNSAGFQTGEDKTIVAFITNGGDSKIGARNTQCIAYSTDGGKNFDYYDRNPVISNISNDNRDPKVVWDDKTHQWIMSLYMDAGFDFGIFSSTNLKDWKFIETIRLEGVTECPGFESLPVDGNLFNKKWILFGANGNYVTGSFDGTHFSPETKVQRGDYGSNFYAAQTWNNAPDDRCLHIAWMPTQRYPDMPFEQQMSFPTDLTLRTAESGVKAYRMPVREIENLYDKEYKWDEVSITSGEYILDELQGDLYDFDLEFEIKTLPLIELDIRNIKITYDASKKMLFTGNINPNSAPMSPIDEKIKLRILLDRTSIEIFGNDGEVVMTSCFVPEDKNLNYSFKTNRDIKVIKAHVHSLKSAWFK